jgi:hypothetical protein
MPASIYSGMTMSYVSVRTAVAVLLLTGFWCRGANAVPAFTDQTGQVCAACHVGGFGPQLTPFGREFKLSGYTLRGTNAFTMPLSAMAVASFVHTQKDQPAPPARDFAVNDNAAVDQINAFLAGGDGSHFGGFAQFTYEGVHRNFNWDNLDLRATSHATLLGSDVLIGASLNNSPTVQDAWNTLPAWGFPYTDTDLAPHPAAGAIISGALAQTTLGLTGYAWWDSHIYTEAGFYWTPARGFLRAVGRDPDDGAGVLDGAAPYLRIAYQKDFGDWNIEGGAFALLPNLHPPGIVAAESDHYADLGLDASYQYMGTGENIYAVYFRYTNERQNPGASFAAGNAANRHDFLQDLRFDASYYWHNMLGATVSPFAIWGSPDNLLYAANRSFTPDSNGIMFQADYTPFANGNSPFGRRFNLRTGIQYTLYGRFNGSSSNFDGAGHNASDNNTLRLFVWLAY